LFIENDWHLIAVIVLSHSFQESSATTSKDGAPGTPHPAAPSGQRNQENTEQSHQNAPVTASSTERWVTSTGQLLRRER
jgi:hypothetical protein